jgi:hypothetical protein
MLASGRSDFALLKPRHCLAGFVFRAQGVKAGDALPKEDDGYVVENRIKPNTLAAFTTRFH